MGDWGHCRCGYQGVINEDPYTLHPSHTRDDYRIKKRSSSACRGLHLLHPGNPRTTFDFFDQRPSLHPGNPRTTFDLFFNVHHSTPRSPPSHLATTLRCTGIIHYTLVTTPTMPIVIVTLHHSTPRPNSPMPLFLFLFSPFQKEYNVYVRDKSPDYR